MMMLYMSITILLHNKNKYEGILMMMKEDIHHHNDDDDLYITIMYSNNTIYMISNVILLTYDILYLVN